MNAATYTAILRVHRDRVYSRALYVLHDADDAADVTQETFLRLWRDGDRVSADRVGGWLTRVAHNLCIDQIRRRRARREHLGTADAAAVVQLPTPAGPDTDPEWRLLLDERQRRVLDAMAALPAETRSVMMMHYYQGLKLREIAQLLDKTVAALKVQIHRARRVLRDVLEGDDAWEPVARREIG